MPRLEGSRPAGHFAVEEWVDFARGVVPENQAERMRQHAHRCAKCRDLSAFYARLHEVTRFMPDRRALKAGN